MTPQTTIIDSLSKDKSYIVKDNENKTFVIFLTGDKNQAGKVEIIINGCNVYVQILGLVIGSNNQTINLYTLQEHLKEKSVSDLLIKSVLFGNSKLSYEGLIKIEKNARKSNAYQKNQNLLFGPNAWADSRPKLEILANDVRCTHGATIGKIDADILYYLKTRGISERQAERLVIEGFYKDVLDRIPDKKISEKLFNEISLKINNLLLN